MNIFALDSSPSIAAKYHCDKHVPKMILETAQLLSTAHHVTGSPIAPQVYKKTHANHPCSIWVRQSSDNYLWALELMATLSNEYTIRFGKLHKSFLDKFVILGNIPDLPDIGLTPFAQAMPEKYKNADPILAYRDYYKFEKSRFAKWERGNATTPFWW